jgi:L-rhamnose mutarotase
MSTVRRAWRRRVRDGCAEEYQRRHREIWPELVESIHARGVRNFSIFMDGCDVFLYAESEAQGEAPAVARAIETAGRAAATAGAAAPRSPESEVDSVRERWRRYMDDVLVPEDDATAGLRTMVEILHLD